MIDAEDEERFAVGGTASVFAFGLADGEFVSAQGVFGAEIARTDTVAAAENARHFFGSNAGERSAKFFRLQRLGEGGADVAAERVVASEAFIGAFENDDVLFAAKSIDDGSFREGANDVDVNGADRGEALFAEVIDGGFDVFGSAAERDENRFGVGGFVFTEEGVTAAGEVTEFLVGLFEETEDRFVEIVAAGDDAVHVMLLVLDGAEEDGVFEVHHFGDAAAVGAEEFALGIGGAGDEIVGSAEKFAEECGFGSEVGTLGMGGEHAVLNVHAGIESELIDLAQDDGLIGGLLGIAGHEHGPAGVESGVKVVVTAMDIESVLGESAGTDLEDHGGELAGSVIVLLHGIDDALAGSEIDGAAAGNGKGGGTTLGGVFAFTFDGDFLLAPDVEFALCIRALVDFTAFGGRSDRVEDASFGHARFHILGDELIPVTSDGNAGIFGRRRVEGSNRGRRRTVSCDRTVCCELVGHIRGSNRQFAG